MKADFPLPRGCEGKIQHHLSSDSFFRPPPCFFSVLNNQEYVAWRSEEGKPAREGFLQLRVWQSIQSTSSLTPTSLTRCHHAINLVSGRKCFSPRVESAFIASSNGLRWTVRRLRATSVKLRVFVTGLISISIRCGELVERRIRASR